MYRDQFPNLKGSENSEGDIFVQVGAAEGADRDLSLVENNQVTCILASHWLGGHRGGWRPRHDFRPRPWFSRRPSRTLVQSQDQANQENPSPDAPIILRSGGVWHNLGSELLLAESDLPEHRDIGPLMRLFVLLD